MDGQNLALLGDIQAGSVKAFVWLELPWVRMSFCRWFHVKSKI